MSKSVKVKAYTGKFSNLPQQRYDVYRYRVRGLLKWQQALRRSNAKGVWEPVATIYAYSGNHACNIARRKFRSNYCVKLRALPTWNRPVTTVDGEVQ